MCARVSLLVLSVPCVRASPACCGGRSSRAGCGSSLPVLNFGREEKDPCAAYGISDTLPTRSLFSWTDLLDEHSIRPSALRLTYLIGLRFASPRGWVLMRQGVFPTLFLARVRLVLSDFSTALRNQNLVDHLSPRMRVFLTQPRTLRNS